MTVELPPEIWDIIAQHFQGQQLISLMGVNRTFMVHAMKEKYRVLSLVWLTDRVLKRLEILSKEDYIAEHVKSVSLQYILIPGVLARKPLPSHPFHRKLKSFAAKAYKKLTPSRGGKAKITFDEASELISKVLPRLKYLTEVTVNYGESAVESPVPSIPWNIYSHTLRTLHLWISSITEIEAHHLPLDIDFPQLSELSIRLDHARKCTALVSPPEISKIIAFINRFQKTLTSLTFVNREEGDIWQGAFNSLGYFPNLTSVDLDTIKGDFGFLARHADSLQELKYSYSFFSEALLPIEFTKLKNVSLFAYASAPIGWWVSPSPFIQSILHTVRTLQLGRWCSSDDVTAFLSTATAIAQGRASGLPLEELSMTLRSLSPVVLPSLAGAFPQLRTLEIYIHELVTDGADPIIPDEFFPSFGENSEWEDTPFIVHLQGALAGVRWGLEDISIKRRGCCYEPIIWGLMIICAQFIPSISSFDSQGDMSVPDYIRIPADFSETLLMKHGHIAWES
ncbi:hypothetical protein FA15DRAFT_671845 [Coprinopsis marcescibilis]|uniref:F-box domain-containing protein n=1 Tax=Coprinopsis marcescibilis TaxID=230819 RepID=A0A5C3KP69_COPMA|nr:hypothetical protein FA15DRAFT_671845 [Coprinopsis marcescibilis]